MASSRHSLRYRCPRDWPPHVTVERSSDSLGLAIGGFRFTRKRACPCRIPLKIWLWIGQLPFRPSLTRRRGESGYVRAALAGSGDSGGPASTLTWCALFSYHVAATQVRGRSSWAWGPFSALRVAFDIQPSSTNIGCMSGVRATAILLGGGVSDRPRPFRSSKPRPPPAPKISEVGP